MRSPFRAVALGLTLSAILACGTKRPPAPVTHSGYQALCVPDPAAVAERRDCVLHETCPCGSHCELGVCQASCGPGASCAQGETCNDLGICQPAKDTVLELPDTQVDAGELAVWPAHVAVFAPTDERTLRLTAGTRAVSKVRVAPRTGGLEVSCDGSTFAKECTLDGVAAGRRADVRVRGTAAFSSPEELRVFWGKNRDGVSFELATPPAAGPALSGLYDGVASLESGGIEGETAAVPLRLPISARVYDSVVVLEDGLGVLHPDKRWIGALDAASMALDLPSFVSLSGGVAAGAPVEVVASVPSVTLTSVAGAQGRSLEADLPVSLTGAGRTIELHWHLSLGRTGDLPAGEMAPEVPMDVAPADPVNADVPTPRERAAFAALPAMDADCNTYPGSSCRNPQIDAAVASLTGGPPSLSACGGRSDTADPTVYPPPRSRIAEAAALDVFLGGPGEALITSGFMDYLTVDSVSFDGPGEAFKNDGRWWVRAVLGSIAGEDTDSSDFANFTKRGRLELNQIPTSFPGQDGSPIYDAIPCAGGFAQGMQPLNYLYPAAGSTPACSQLQFLPSFGEQNVDMCDAVRQKYGCDVVTIKDAPSAFSDFYISGWITGAAATFDFQGDHCSFVDPEPPPWVPPGSKIFRLDVVKACVLRPPPSCAEGIACWEGPGGGSSSLGSGAAGTGTGDLACAAGARSLSIPLDTSAADDSAIELTQACLDDLDALQKDPEGDTAALLADGPCLSATRLLWALGAAGAGPRGADGTLLDARGARVAHRLLQRWVDVHAALATQAVQAGRLADVIREVDGKDPSLPAQTLDQALDTSLRGWDLLFHPRFAALLDRLPGEVLATPDYRPDVTGMPALATPDDEQPEGLAVVMLEALEPQAQIVLERLDVAMYHGDQTALDSAGKLLRYALHVRPLAASLRARAEAWATASAAPAPAWLARYDAAAGTAARALGKVLALSAALRAGANPMGIEESDLPLYFLGSSPDPGARFNAISAYLLRKIQSEDLSAPALVDSADAALQDARTAWTEFNDRKLQRRLDQTQGDARLDAIRFDYGNQIGAICGYPGDTDTLLEQWEQVTGRPFSGRTCYIKSATEDPSCAPVPGSYAALLQQDDVLYQFCLASKLQLSRQLEPSFAAISSSWDVRNPQGVQVGCSAPGVTVFPVTCPAGGDSCARCTQASGDLYADIDHAHEQFEHMYTTSLTPQALEDANTACRKDYPRAVTLPPAPTGTNVPQDGTCFRGSLGEAALTVASAANDVAIARSQFRDLTDAYLIATESCRKALSRDQDIADAISSFNDEIKELDRAKLGMDILANMAGAAKDCASTVAGEGDDPFQSFASDVSCYAGLAEATFESISDGLGFAMDNVQRDHDLNVQNLQKDGDYRVCMNDAGLNLVGARTAALGVKGALQQLRLESYRMEQLESSAEGTYADGLTVLQRAKDRTVVAPSNDYWLDERLTRFLDRMRLARRVTYLATRAVEYEQQQTLMVRGAVLTATTPEELRQKALEPLLETAGTGLLDGKRPSELTVVLSLRDQILQLADRNGLPKSELPLSPTERLRERLEGDRYLVVDEATGAILGRRIPFHLAPLAALGLGKVEGVPIYSTSDCAERLWSVNASIVGGPGLYRGTSASVRLNLEKSNTFYSQWCASRDQGFQTASVRPSRNLYRDDLFVDTLTSGFTPSPETQTFSTARLQAFLNVDARDLSGAQYTSGETSELAARGLYGDYALFIPASEISTTGPDGTSTDGLVLDQVQDILLRLDYVSVAK